MENNLNYRKLSLGNKPITLDENDRSVEVVAATENPVEIFDYERWEVLTEVLLMRGCKLSEKRQIPLLDTHQRYDTASVLGSFREITIKDNKLMGRAFFSTVSEAEPPYIKVKEGHLTDFSIAYQVTKSKWIPMGESENINGRTYNGPIKVVTDWKPKELSVCPVGADEQAQARSKQITREERGMNEQLRAFLESRGMPKEASETEAWAYLETLDVPKETEKKQEIDINSIRQEAIEKERERIREIEAMCSKFNCSNLAEQFIDSGTSVVETRETVMEHIYKNKEKEISYKATIKKDERDKFRSAALDSILIRSGINPEKSEPGADNLAGFSLRELARESLRIANQRINGDPREMVGRALTTSDFPYILADSANKSLERGFEKAEETWNRWCATGAVSDFKVHTRVRASELENLEEVPEGGEYLYGERAEAKEEYKIFTFGRLFAITRQTIINDDLGALTDVPAAHGEAAARKIGDIVYAVLDANSRMGDTFPLFHEQHQNVMKASRVNVDTIGEAIKAMKLQKDIKNIRRLNIRPQFFIAPVSLEASSEQFFNTILIGGAENQPNLNNPYAGSYFERIYDPRIDEDSQTVWYLAGPKGKTITVFFLDGRQTPYMETRQGWTVDGVEYKVRIDAGAKAMDWRALVLNPGTATHLRKAKN